MMLVDLTKKGITGKQAQLMLDEVMITVNKNGIPFDTQSPAVTSGIRIGTPAVTTRGMKEAEMKEIATLIDLALSGEFEKNKEAIIGRVGQLTTRFPLY
jgi:glycine hydroxymethyltransferase